MRNFLSRMLGGGAEGDRRLDWVECDALRQRLDAGEKLLIVDVRGPDEFAGPLGHIPGSINLPLAALTARQQELTVGQRPVVFVCHTDKRSSQAAVQLQATGADRVSVLRGGMVQWRASEQT